MYGPAVSAQVGEWAAQGAWEHLIHSRLRQEGHHLSFEPSARVDLITTYRLRELIALRYSHGLGYARDRREFGEGGKKLIAKILASPIVPFLMTLRLARACAREDLRRFLAALPIVLLLYLVWVAGETVGYLTGPTDRG